MKVASLRAMVPIALLVLALPGASRADHDDVGPTPRVPGVRSKIEFCNYCHGAQGQGYRAYFTMPRLAGQQPEYMVNQLRAFAEGHRKNRFMSKVSASLSPSMRESLAHQYAAMSPKPLGHDGSGERTAEGRRIFLDGLPNENIPACAACHGLEGQGYGPIPRLAGQLSPYTQKQLANWASDRGSDETAGVMAAVARHMSKSQIAAVAAYLGALK
jgi:cytochrome c553